ncbi:MAG: glycosyltransferase [Microbacteriaceae bacterium]|nr:glycosyltransferase [Microbacteriaceae bacterium]
MYVHTPARYVWAADHDERGQSAAARFLSPALKQLDRRRASEGPQFAANSEFIRTRIRSSWNQDATVIYPPVHVEKLQSGGPWRDRLSGEDEAILSGLPETFIFSASRFVAYKRLEAAIQTGEIARIPVVIAGSGPLLAQLTNAAKIASIAVHIVNRPSDNLLYALYEAAALFVFPAVEDFGIMPVEAMSLGTPALVTTEGGASESVGILRGGVVVDFASPSDLARAIEAAIGLDMTHAVQAARTQFGDLAFIERLDNWMAASLSPRPIPALLPFA